MALMYISVLFVDLVISLLYARDVQMGAYGVSRPLNIVKFARKLVKS